MSKEPEARCQAPCRLGTVRRIRNSRPGAGHRAASEPEETVRRTRNSRPGAGHRAASEPEETVKRTRNSRPGAGHRAASEPDSKIVRKSTSYLQRKFIVKEIFALEPYVLRLITTNISQRKFLHVAEKDFKFE